ncbi:MAG TPA: hypothetical protein VK804_14515, partial [Bradyrhizobium sp.]|uniref:hypothetical protein n=1 Tax=Bradyrhizobium sp. TaxID=376 RepID=UPI002BB5E2B3
PFSLVPVMIVPAVTARIVVEHRIIKSRSIWLLGEWTLSERQTISAFGALETWHGGRDDVRSSRQTGSGGPGSKWRD